MDNSLFDNLNQSQKDAVLCTEGPLIIFAGAGTGKTRVITHRIAHLLSKGVKPWQILAVTFTNKAAGEMKKRVNDLAPGAGANVSVSTFHSFCAYFLRVEASKINLNPDFLIYDFADQKNVVKDCLKELNIDEKKYKPSTVVDRISRAKDDLKFPSDMAADAQANGDFFGTTIAKAYALYQKKLELASALDFGDLIMRVVVALRQYPALLEHYQQKYKYILVDEYQDTNHAQYVLTKLLAQKHQNICVVGDDDQSVYSWRGADITNILDFEKDYPSAKSVKLEQNYRSTPKILETAYKVVKNNQGRIEKKLWTQNADDGGVSVVKSANENEEAARVVDLITINSQNEKYNLSDFAVFYRTNAQSRVFEDAFRRAGMSYAVIGTLRFYDRAEIKDIMAYLKLIHNPNDNVSFKRVINVPRRGIGKTSMENLEKFAGGQGLSIWQTLDRANEAGINKGAINALNAFAEFIKAFMHLKETESVKEIAQKIITHSGYLKELEDENTPESKTKIENIQELISAIEDFEQRSPDNKTLSDYLTQIALISDTDSLDDSNGKVTLMTLHLAKGLEFDNVFICGLEEGLFPIGESAFNPEELEEERRLMYVGMTRARKHLYLCWASERTVYGKTRWNMASRFITEAGFKDEFTQSPEPKPFFNRGFNRAKWNATSKTEPKYQKDDTYDYIPSDDDIIKDEPLYTPVSDNSPYKIGALVRHPVFGNGKIIEKTGAGNDVKLVVLFENGQWKKLLARVANLTLV
ncbi:ATP-dependent helicase [Endomicrobium proavitum]|uniref:DNA 3'-5' helicase n=1 Tax=Endomicrobium proavitum TaxID=1408281 RepID=A0A0G3WLL9_9BACT|nr:UvrD-helicase domain-containing protein [Endomicrobium proavitum]AKL98399.1 ATP-dependent DNA helicase PcrA [Endomicrobium proavitum]